MFSRVMGDSIATECNSKHSCNICDMMPLYLPKHLDAANAVT